MLIGGTKILRSPAATFESFMLAVSAGEDETGGTDPSSADHHGALESFNHLFGMTCPTPWPAFS